VFGHGYFGAGYFGPGYFGPAVEVGGRPYFSKKDDELKTLEQKQDDLTIEQINDNIVQRVEQELIEVPEVTTNRDFAEANINELIKEEIKDLNVDNDIDDMLMAIAINEATS